MALSSSLKHYTSLDLLNSPHQEDGRLTRTAGNSGRSGDGVSFDASTVNLDDFSSRIDDNPSNALIISEIDQTLKKHADTLLRTLEGVNAQLSKLEIKTCNIEGSVDDMKESIGNGNSKRRLRKVENILREVQETVQGLREKPEPIEAPQVIELQSIGGGQQSEDRNSSTDEVSAHVQSHQSFNTPITQQFHQIPVPPHLNNLQHQTQQNPGPVQLHSQCQIAPILEKEPTPAPGQLPHTTPEQYQIPPTQQLQAQPIASHQQYQSLHQLPPHSQPHQLSQQHSPVVPVNASPFVHHPEENPYMPTLPQAHQARFHQLPSMAEPFSHPLPSQQFHSAPSMHEPLPSRCSTDFASRFDQTPGITSSEAYGYSSFPQYRSAAMQSPQIYSSSPSSGSRYPHLPTAQVLPESVTADRSAVGGSSTSETGNQIPVNDVAEKVVTMGFPRDQVRAAMKEQTDNGLSVDLNSVLDKLRNDGENKPKKGWFRR